MKQARPMICGWCGKLVVGDCETDPADLSTYYHPDCLVKARQGKIDPDDMQELFGLLRKKAKCQ